MIELVFSWTICVLLVMAVGLWLLYQYISTYRTYGQFSHLSWQWFPLNTEAMRLLKPDNVVNTQLEFISLGAVVHMNVFGENWLVVSDMDLVTEIIRDRESFPNQMKFRKALIKTMGQSMFASEGDLWKEKHEILLPMMRQQMMEQYTTTVQHKCKELLRAIELDLNVSNERDSNEVELVSLMKRYTLDVIGDMAFGVDFKALSSEQQKFGKWTFSEMADFQINAINLRLLLPKFLWNLPLPIFAKEKQTGVILKEMFEGLLQQTEEQMDNGDTMNNLPSLLLNAHNSSEHIAKEVYPREQILGESFSVWGAGHDTTTYTCVHTLKYISMHPEVQNKARQEVLELDEFLNGEAPTYSQISQCKYIDAVLKESQRLLPIAPYLVRESLREKDINGVTIPKNTTILLNIGGLQRSENHFDNPNEFIPERWLVKNEKSIFLTFGMGKRSCFGKKLAVMEIKMMIYYLLKNYDLLDNSILHPHDVELNFGLVPKGKKLLLSLQKR